MLGAGAYIIVWVCCKWFFSLWQLADQPHADRPRMPLAELLAAS